MGHTPVTRCSVMQDRVVAEFWSPEPRALWPRGAAATWPPPRVVPARLATAEWRTHRCDACRNWRAQLVTLGRMDAGAELTVSSQTLVIGWQRDALPYELSFDGCLRSVGGQCAAGAGAALWGPLAEGRPLLRRAAVALPDVTDVVVAEAWGCRIALRLLAAVPPRSRAVRICGDNPDVVRHGGAVGRLRRREAQVLLEEPLGRIAADGWDTEWTLIPRQANGTAHLLAAAGADRARALQDAGRRSAEICLWGAAVAGPADQAVEWTSLHEGRTL